ncbi:hypothetical protein GWI33_003293 [Rhynchophorus ferrugineus]|uniref:Uncharacterized protein n=1 Tax=Rhynchophorus ferrugineus TaxID=354439 RepID=A0A834ILM4_RHYFE|nr:hypothetical protein GWI33_003293 [Rhynchophorus ferrugineus]
MLLEQKANPARNHQTHERDLILARFPPSIARRSRSGPGCPWKLDRSVFTLELEVGLKMLYQMLFGRRGGGQAAVALEIGGGGGEEMGRGRTPPPPSTTTATVPSGNWIRF